MIRDNTILAWATFALIVILYLYVHGIPSEGVWLP
jgi:hypothetical protein